MELITANRANGILYHFLKYQKQEDKCWILPSNICPEVVLTFLKAGCKFRFIDLEEKELGINLKQVEEAIHNGGIAGVLYNHTYGNEYTPDQHLIEIKNNNPELLLVDDRCLCDPQINFDSSWADLVLFSTNFRKQVDLGYGGYGFTNTKIEPGEILEYKKKEYDKVSHELKATVDPEHWRSMAIRPWLDTSAMGISTKKYFEDIKNYKKKWNKHKQSLISIYKKHIPRNMQLGPHFNNWRFNIHVKNKSDLIRHIFRERLFVSNHYPSIGSIIERKRFPVAEWLYRYGINLFIDKHYTEKMVYRTVQIINKYGNPI